jgi:hypothetical protein
MSLERTKELCFSALMQTQRPCPYIEGTPEVEAYESLVRAVEEAQTGKDLEAIGLPWDVLLYAIREGELTADPKTEYSVQEQYAMNAGSYVPPDPNPKPISPDEGEQQGSSRPVA